MGDELAEVTAPAVEEKRQEGLPRLLWPIVFRFAAAAWFTVEVAREPADYAVLGVIFIVVPSLAIGVGLLLRQSELAWIAVCGDCSIAAFYLACRLGILSPYAYGPPRNLELASDLPMLLLCSVAVIEGGYILRKLTHKWVWFAAYVPVTGLFLWLGWLAGLAPD